MQLDTLFFIGPQGSGKGTQAKILASKLGFYYWEMGAILREEAKLDTPLGKIIADQINKGLLLDDKELKEVMIDKLEALPHSKGILFDGIPRRLGQAEFIVDYLKQKGHTNFTTVFLDIPYEVSVQRLLERAHHEFRKDDTEAGIRIRLSLYEKETLPVLDFLKQHGKFINIDGQPSIEQVTKDIAKALDLDNA